MRIFGKSPACWLLSVAVVLLALQWPLARAAASPGPPVELTLEQERRVGRVEVGVVSLYQAATLGYFTATLVMEAEGVDSSSHLWPQFWMSVGHIPGGITLAEGWSLALSDGSSGQREQGSGVGLVQNALFAGAMTGLILGTRALYQEKNGCHRPSPYACVDDPYLHASATFAVVWSQVTIATALTGAIVLARRSRVKSSETRLKRRSLPASARWAHGGVQLVPWASTRGGGLGVWAWF